MGWPRTTRTGVADLDAALGGGLAAGTVCLVVSDRWHPGRALLEAFARGGLEKDEALVRLEADRTVGSLPVSPAGAAEPQHERAPAPGTAVVP